MMTYCWHLVFKHHMFEHMAQQCQWLNPRYTWTFKSEDYVGRISKLAHACTYGVQPSELPKKIFEKYRIMLHLKLCKQWVDDTR